MPRTPRVPSAPQGAPPAAARRASAPRRRSGPVSSGDGGEPAIPNDLIDVEAPPQGGAAVDTAAYAAPSRVAEAPAIDSDLVDVEAPPQGGAQVDTAAYAAGSRLAEAPAIDSDLVDVEAPPAGGAQVDTAAYARTGAGGRDREPGADAPPRSLVDAQAPPPPPMEAARGPQPDADPLDGEAGGAPPPAGPELGGGVSSPPSDDDLLDRAALAALRLAADRPWPEVTLRDVAREAGTPFAALYARAPGRRALLLALSARLDREALERSAADDSPSRRDRLFEAFMSRLEVMQPHRDVLLAIGRAEGMALAPALPRTVRALAEGAGLDTSGARGALRVAALTAVWARTLQVWRDDEGALNRTMAEIDTLLTRADKRLSRLRAGF